MALATERRKGEDTRADWTDFYHTGPGTLAGQWLRRFWHPIHRSQDLAPGRAIPFKIMDEHFTLYRGQTGAAHAVAFRCAHRGTQLSVGWVEGDDIRCRYHGWKYDPSGQCVEQPAELQPFCEKVRIQSYQTQEYLGLIFIYMGEGETPPLPRYPEVEGEGVLEVVKPNLSESNYFRRIEQIGDEAHHLFAHRRETPHSKFGLQPVMVTETEYGMLQTATFASGVRTRHYLVPNIMYVTNNAALPEETDIRKRFMWKVPVDDDHYWNLGVLFVHLRGEAARRYLDGQAEREAESERADTPGKLKRILAGEMALEEIEDRSDISHLEDEVVLAGIGLCDERPLDEHLAPSDAGVILKRKIWERELRALAEGHPLKEWKRSEVLTVSEGM